MGICTCRTSRQSHMMSKDICVRRRTPRTERAKAGGPGGRRSMPGVDKRREVFQGARCWTL